jgi:hypothetical protein
MIHTLKLFVFIVSASTNLGTGVCLLPSDHTNLRWRRDAALHGSLYCICDCSKGLTSFHDISGLDDEYVDDCLLGCCAV